jgi:hypothetical protein
MKIEKKGYNTIITLDNPTTQIIITQNITVHSVKQDKLNRVYLRFGVY